MVKTFVIKIDIDFNLNVLLKLFFPLFKKIIFFSPNYQTFILNFNISLKSNNIYHKLMGHKKKVVTRVYTDTITTLFFDI